MSTPDDTVRYIWAECEQQWVAEVCVDGAYFTGSGITKAVALVNAAAVATGRWEQMLQLVGDYGQLQLAGRRFLSDIRAHTLRDTFVPHGYLIMPETFSAFERVLNSHIAPPGAPERAG